MILSDSAPAGRDMRVRPGPRLWLMRGLWLAGAALGIAVLVAGILDMQPSSLGLESPGPVPLGQALSYGYYQVLSSLGVDLLFAAVFLAVGVVIVWRRSADGYTLAVSLGLILYGITGTLAVQNLQGGEGIWSWLALALNLISTASVPVLAYAFPDGRFIPRWTRWLAALWGLLAIAGTLVPALNPHTWPPPYLYALMLLGLATAIAAQVYRYRHVSTPAQQQQTKWVIFGFAAATLGFAAVSGLMWLTPWLRGVAFLQFLYAHWSFYLSQLIVPVCIGLSVLRYRLWDIDLVINRTAVYTIAGALVVALFYFLSQAGDRAVNAVFGKTSAAAPLASALVSAMVFSPLKERTQKTIDRRFYREKVDLQTAFADFSHQIRRITEVDGLLQTLVNTVSELLHVKSGAVYISENEDGFRLVAQATATAQRPAWVPDPATLRKLEMGLDVSQPEDGVFPLLIPLTLPPAARAGNSPWKRWIGVLALGPRLSGRGFSREDCTLLLTLADQVGTAVYVALTVHRNEK